VARIRDFVYSVVLSYGMRNTWVSIILFLCLIIYNPVFLLFQNRFFWHNSKAEFWVTLNTVPYIVQFIHMDLWLNYILSRSCRLWEIFWVQGFVFFWAILRIFCLLKRTCTRRKYLYSYVLWREFQLSASKQKLQ